MIPTIWGIKYDTNESIYKREIGSQIWRTDLWLPRGKRGWGDLDWEFWISRCKPLYIYIMGRQQGPTV